MSRTAVGYFRDRASADRAYDALMQNGFDRDDVSVIGRGAEGRTGLADDGDQAKGAATGAAAGGILGLLIGAAALAIPGIGPIVAIGPLAASLTGAAAGAATGAVVGGVAGALTQAGVPEDEARYYEERFRTGGILLVVRTSDERHGEARTLLDRYGAETRGHNVQAVGREALANDPGALRPTPPDAR